MIKDPPYPTIFKFSLLLATLAVGVPGPAVAHDPYTGIFNFNGVNCCTGHDCLQAADPSDFEPISNGYKVRSTGEVVPMSTTGFSPDANWHICRKSDSKKTIRCLLVPAGGA
jgi:hypothetical protein